eukprot:9475973-Pyramimonas_sp.AAC.1
MRGWKPHFSNTLARTRSGVMYGVKPLDTTCRASRHSEPSGVASQSIAEAGAENLSQSAASMHSIGSRE